MTDKFPELKIVSPFAELRFEFIRRRENFLSGKSNILFSLSNDEWTFDRSRFYNNQNGLPQFRKLSYPPFPLTNFIINSIATSVLATSEKAKIVWADEFNINKLLKRIPVN